MMHMTTDEKSVFNELFSHLAEIDAEGRPHPKHYTEIHILAVLTALGYEPSNSRVQQAFFAARNLVQEDGTFCIHEVAAALTERLTATGTTHELDRHHSHPGSPRAVS